MIALGAVVYRSQAEGEFEIQERAALTRPTTSPSFIQLWSEKGAQAIQSRRYNAGKESFRFTRTGHSISRGSLCVRALEASSLLPTSSDYCYSDSRLWPLGRTLHPEVCLTSVQK